MFEYGGLAANIFRFTSSTCIMWKVFILSARGNSGELDYVVLVSVLRTLVMLLSLHAADSGTFCQPGVDIDTVALPESNGKVQRLSDYDKRGMAPLKNPQKRWASNVPEALDATHPKLQPINTCCLNQVPPLRA